MVKTIKINSMEEMKKNSIGFEFIPYMEYIGKGTATVIDVASLGKSGVYIRFTNYVTDELGKRTALNVEHQFVKEMCLVQNTIDYSVALMARNADLDKLEASEVILPRRKSSVTLDDDPVETPEEQTNHLLDDIEPEPADDDIETDVDSIGDDEIFEPDLSEEDYDDDELVENSLELSEEEDEEDGVSDENTDVGDNAPVDEGAAPVANKIRLGSGGSKETREETSERAGEGSHAKVRTSEKRDNAGNNRNDFRNDKRRESDNRRNSKNNRNSKKEWKEEGWKTGHKDRGIVKSNFKNFVSPGGMDAASLRQMLEDF